MRAGESLKMDLLAGLEIQRARRSSSGKSPRIAASVAAMSDSLAESAAHRKGPLPSQKSGLIYAGANPG